MTKAPIKVNEHFTSTLDQNGKVVDVIYSPPLLAESENIRIELRKEENHGRPHVHIIKKGRNKSHDISVALDDLTILAGQENLKHFNEDEFEKISDFIEKNQNDFKKLYINLRGNL